MTDYRKHTAIIVATDTEEAAVKNMYDWQQVKFECDDQIYYSASFKRDDVEYGVVYAKQNEMGMTAAAALSMKLIEHFCPRYLIMVGIAAGIALSDVEEQIYGDVIVADIIWNYSAGKFVSNDKADITFGDVGFIPRPTFIKMHEDIRAYVEAAAASAENQCHVYIGPMASGSAVVANNQILNRQIRSQLAHTAGLDMEAYAVAYAAENAVMPKPAPLIIKSVCDYADARKSDRYQRFAAFTSCEFAKLLYEKYLPAE